VRQIECEFEADVLAAVMQSRWPERVDAGLQAHVKACGICADVAAVAGAIEYAREETAECAAIPHTLPDSGLVWWKAQMRARREDVNAVGRPITAVQVAAFACAMALMGACIGATSSWFQGAVKWAWGQVASIDPAAIVPYATTLIEGHGLLAACMLAMVFVVPVAVYLAIGKEDGAGKGTG
jgi:hypothetical protein